MKFPRVKKKHLKNLSKGAFWFLTGAFIAVILLTGFSFSIYQTLNRNVVYPGVFINGLSFGGKSQAQVKDYFDRANEKAGNTQFIFVSPAGKVSITSSELSLGYNSNLLSIQAYSIGRGKDILSNASLILQAYTSGINLSPSYGFSQEKLHKLILPLQQQLNIDPVEALFSFENGKVIAFRPSADGKMIDEQELFG